MLYLYVESAEIHPSFEGKYMILMLSLVSLAPLFLGASLILTGNTTPSTMLLVSVVSVICSLFCFFLGRKVLSEDYHDESHLEEGEVYEVVMVHPVSKVVVLKPRESAPMLFLFTSHFHLYFNPGDVFRVNERETDDLEPNLSVRMLSSGLKPPRRAVNA